ncbi:hypothetical protein TNCV_2965401 [Trichonephila clavipes]|nr:hypothetical protein TNCV_2965401 [Trichonephila clavipes]
MGICFDKLTGFGIRNLSPSTGALAFDPRSMRIKQKGSKIAFVLIPLFPASPSVYISPALNQQNKDRNASTGVRKSRDLSFEWLIYEASAKSKALIGYQ